MLRALFSHRLVMVVLAVTTTLAFSTAIVPALGGQTATQAKKRKVKRGPPGPPGPQGPPGAAATSLWAIVGVDGSLAAQSSGVVGASHLGTGLYDVFFNRAVNKCAKVATPTNFFALLLATSDSGGDHSVRIAATSIAAGSVNVSFNLAVFC